MPSPGRGSVYSATIKPSTRSARSISVNSVLRLWRHGGRREPPIGCGPRPHCVLRPLPLRERGRGEGFLPATTPIHAVARFGARKKRPPVGVASGAKRNRASVFVIAMRTYSPLGLAGAVPLFLLLPAL